MAVTNFSPLLGLALPTTGDLTGTWGQTVNDSITTLLDSAVAGTTTLILDTDVTLTTTNGASNQARNAVIVWTASGTATRYITAPAHSKAYIVINATGGTQSIVIRGVGPTTGVTIPAGKKALVAWNGSDFVRIASTNVDLTSEVTGVLPVANGGTGGLLPVANGGTGATTLTGLVKGSGTSAFTAATAGTDYLAPPSGTAILKANSGGALANATAGTDYQAAITASGLLKGAGGGSVSAAVAGTDYVTPTGTETLTNKTLTTPGITNPTITNYIETFYAPSAGSAFTVDLANGTVQQLTTNANTTITLPSAVAGKGYTIIVAYGGTHSITWAGGSTIKWAYGTAPSTASTSGKFDIFVFTCSGTYTFGRLSGGNY